MSYLIELETAISAVARASQVCQSIRESKVAEQAIAKSDRSPVTIADFGSQAVLIHALKAAFPHDRIVAEEESSQMRLLGETPLGEAMLDAVQGVLPSVCWEDLTSLVDMGADRGGAKGRFWTIDPIDGTKGYLRNEQYAVALALIEDGIPVVGVLGCPNYPIEGFESDAARKGLLFRSSKGDGAFAHPMRKGEGGQSFRKLVVTDAGAREQWRMCESFESGHSAHGDSARVARSLGLTRGPLRIDSQAKYAAVASGHASVYLRMPASRQYREKIWDHAAGVLLLEESGGKVSDIDGKPLDFTLGRNLDNNRGILATAGSLHPEVLLALLAG